MWVNYAGRPDWRILEVQSPNKVLSAQAIETQRTPGGQVTYQLKTVLAPGATPGLFREQLQLVTNDPANPRVPLSVEASIESDITLQTNAWALGNVVAGQTKTMNLVVRGKRPFRITAIECEKSNDMFSVQKPGDEKPLHIVLLKFTAPNQPLEINELFTIAIEGRPDPLALRVTGRVMLPGVPAAAK
jgi:hypothetical protein